MPAENELSERELEILRLVATGASNKDIAVRLFISPNTVKVHMRNIFTKIGVVSRTEATLYAIRTGLVASGAAVLEPAASAEPAAPVLMLEAAQPVEPPKRLNWRWGLAGGLGLALLALLVVWAVLTWFPRALPAAATPELMPTLPPRWQTSDPLPQGRAGMAGVVYENDLYLFGGETSQGVSADVLCKRVGETAWQTRAEKPTAVSEFQAAVLGGLVYAPGGQTASGSPTQALEVYDPIQDRWSRRADLPLALSRYALAVFEGRLYVFGGWDGRAYSRQVWTYDPQTDQWSERSPLPSARGWAGAAALGTKIYVVGGADGAAVLDSVLGYYPQRDQPGGSPWEKLASLPQARLRFGLTALADQLYLVGGETTPGRPASLEPLQYLPSNDRWQPLESSNATAVSAAQLLPFENRLHVLGGRTLEGLSSQYLTYQVVYTILVPIVH